MGRVITARTWRGVILIVALGVVVMMGATVVRGAWQAPSRVAGALPPPPFRSMGELSPELTRMLLAVEDPRFFDHHGVDFRTPGAGWTTISQGLVKILYFERFRPGPLPKLEQTLLAIGFDAATPKRLQLDLFWNRAYLGTRSAEDVEGFPRGANVWFGRDVTKLERRQFLTLVAMLMAPNRFAPDRHPEAVAERVGRIERMLAGRCEAAEWRDVEYEGCASGPGAGFSP